MSHTEAEEVGNSFEVEAWFHLDLNLLPIPRREPVSPHRVICKYSEKPQTNVE